MNNIFEDYITSEKLLQLGFNKAGKTYYKGHFRIIENELNGATGYRWYASHKGVPISNVNTITEVKDLYFKHENKEL